MSAGGIAALLGGQLLAIILSNSKTEGAYAMGLTVFWVPVAAIAGATLSVTAVARCR
mgnify:CR=1 FL=1